MFDFTKSSLVLYLSLTLVTGSLLQISLTDFFENNNHVLLKIPSIYASDDGGNGNGGGNDGGDEDGNGGDEDGNGGDEDGNAGDVSDDSGDSDNVEALSLEEDTEEEEAEIGQEDTPEELTLSEDGGSEVLTLRQGDKDAGEVLTLEDGEDETEPTEPPTTEPPTTEPPTTEPPTTEPPTTEPPTTEPPTTEPPTTEPIKVENDTSVQQAEQKAPQVVAGVADKDVEDMEDYLDKTRDERVDRDICGHYSGVWNYNTKDCEIDDPDRKKEYEKERKESSRYDQVLCPGYGGEWNDKEMKCEIEDLEDRTDYEDTLCDDPADSILYDICNFERYKGNTPEQIKEYDKNQCLYAYDGKWNEDTLSCETENPDYQKYLKERHNIYSCITSGKEWNDQKNTCETKPPGHPDGDYDRRDHDNGKRHYKEVIKIINNNVIIVRGFDNIDREIFVIGDANTCPAQSSTVTLSGKINPKEIRILGDFYPCYIEDGSVTLNIPDTQNIKLAVLSMDEIGNYYQTALINPIKMQKIDANQTLFTVELDNTMTGINPNTEQKTTVTNINGLALYNYGNNAVQFKSGNNIAALTASFTR